MAGASQAPGGGASTKSEAPAPVMERAAAPRYESGRFIAGPAASPDAGRLPGMAPPLRRERPREAAAACASTPLYLANCSLLC